MDKQGQPSSSNADLPFGATTYSDRNAKGPYRYGTPVCWGVDATPVEDERFTEINSGHYQTCGLREDGSVRCWGPRASVFRLEEGERFTAISVSVYACGLRKDGSMFCWWDVFEPLTSPPENHHFTAVATGGIQTCAFRDDAALLCWTYAYDSATALSIRRTSNPPMMPSVEVPRPRLIPGSLLSILIQ